MERLRAAADPSAAGQATTRAAWQRAVVLGVRILQVADLAVEPGLRIRPALLARILFAGCLGRILPVLFVVWFAGHGVVLLSGRSDTSAGPVIGRCRLQGNVAAAPPAAHPASRSPRSHRASGATDAMNPRSVTQLQGGMLIE